MRIEEWDMCKLSGSEDTQSIEGKAELAISSGSIKLRQSMKNIVEESMHEYATCGKRTLVQCRPSNGPTWTYSLID